MTTLSLPSLAFAGYLVRDWFGPLIARRGRASRPQPENATEAARRVREYAFRIRSQDPRMADELCAAADRHERLHQI